VAAIVANAAVIPANGSGSFDAYVTDNTWVVVDINGYYVSPNALALGLGSSGTPSLSFGTDTTSGLFSLGSGTISIATGGVEQMRVNSAGLSASKISSQGNLDFGYGGSGNITQNGATLVQSGTSSLGIGLGALPNLGTGYNAAFGPLALATSNSSAEYDTAIGYSALYSNAAAQYNTGVGNAALYYNNAGMNNSAVGAFALESYPGPAHSVGNDNTAVGYASLYKNTASQGTAVGSGALQSNSTGTDNTAVGFWALNTNNTGTDNTALGYQALYGNTGNGNTAVGSWTGGYSVGFTGSYNTFVGHQAGNNAISGSSNVGIGYEAGWNLTSGYSNTLVGTFAGTGLLSNEHDNIMIGNSGTSGDIGTIRIGSGTQGATFIAGIYSSSTSGGVPVYVTSSGRLGYNSSSRNVKRDIRDMGDTTDTIMGLHPVRFHYKDSGPGEPEQYGLIAEEVAEVAPDLAFRDQEGNVKTVYYDKVNAMLLNEVQKLHRVIEQLTSRLSELENRK